MTATLEVGAEFAGYRIERYVSRGGMGVIYQATDLELQRTVALKLVAPEPAEDDDFRARFKQESRLAAGIDHPNVIPIYEASEADGSLFIAMRYVDGIDLRSLLRRDGALEPRRAANLVQQIASALDAAHRQGLVHRDVKPGNVLIGGGPGEEHVYLTDFGLTKHAASISGLTRTGQWVGTLDYVAPEQLTGGSVDARTDIYALGCILYETVTGRIPFTRDNDAAKLWAHMNDPPPRVTGARRELSPALDDVVARAMAKQPDDRYPSAGDLGRAAVAAVQDRPLAEPERSVAAGAAAPGAASPTAADPQLPEPTVAAGTRATSSGGGAAGGGDVTAGTRAVPGAPAGRRRLALWGGAVIAVVVAGVLVVLLTQGGKTKNAGSVPASGTSSASPTSCGGGLSVGPQTSCPFAKAVRTPYLAKGGGDITIVVRSPVTNKDYTLACTNAATHVCTATTGAKVYFKSTARQRGRATRK